MSPVGAEPITVAVTRRVRAGREAEFEAALHEFIERSVPRDGQLGVHVIRPAPGDASRTYGILRRFRDEASRDAFYSSDEFRDWEARVAALTEGERSAQVVTGLEAWFTPPGVPIMPPARWRMAVVTLLGVWPLSAGLGWALRPVLSGLPHLLGSLLMAALMVAGLTWAVMPLLARLLHGFLHPAAARP